MAEALEQLEAFAGRLADWAWAVSTSDSQVPELAELDRLANRVALDLSDWDDRFDEVEDARLSRALSAYAPCVAPLLQRYVELRQGTDTPLGAPSTLGEYLTATIGLEALAGREGFEFLSALIPDAEEDEEDEAS